jgi:hypothetical protein
MEIMPVLCGCDFANGVNCHGVIVVSNHVSVHYDYILNLPGT